MADEIKLTLGVPQAPNAAETVAEAAAEEQAVAQQVQVDAAAKQVFSPEEQKMIDDFSKQIDIRDSNLVFAYGASAQQNIAQFSDSALKNVQTKDLDQVGNMISSLVVELRGFDADEESKGLFGFMKKQSKSVALMKARYDKCLRGIRRWPT